MLTDGIKDQEKEGEIRQLDVAELLAEAVALDAQGGASVEAAAE
jgi:hypothetical protein